MSTERLVEIDVAGVTALSDRIGAFGGDQLQTVATEAVNEVADHTYALAKRRMIEGLSLTEAYLERKLSVEKAKVGPRPRAVITAVGSHTLLGHYAPQMVTAPTKTKKSKGNPALGIPAGQKLAGVTVEVAKGARKQVLPTQNTVFMVPKFKDTEGNPLIFERMKGTRNAKGKEKLRALFGPSVYQLFKYQVDLIIDDVTEDLNNTLATRAEEALQKALEQ